MVRREPVGGGLLLLATVAALVWANTPAAPFYSALRGTTVGPSALHVRLSVGRRTADGLLAIFFVVGLEPKHEFVLGALRDPRRALVRSPRPSAGARRIASRQG
ncbi:Na+/H+ antiporter NhaA [Pseudonocardia kujensis]|uniref:Na+/H+ antiporter NhaA n=1 Tax=Pseudonocardia kujensis TaxID=1128675 RepID=UPI001E5A3C38|nr:Na+/H+ antiporter NhaA [Pseudonocardia kujensis]MCE0764391.1 Na+/H+ antiporter NhaA [Pseudonocardia kujensis]